MTRWAGIEELHLSRLRPPGPLPEVPLSLARLVDTHGPVDPVVVRSRPRGYEILSNAETWLAAQRAGWHEVPIELRDEIDDTRAAEIRRLSSRSQGPDPTEEARQFEAELARRCRDGRLPHGGVTRAARERVRSRSYLSHARRLLKLPPLVRQYVATGRLSAGHARALVTLRHARRRGRVTERILRDGLSVRETETLVRGATIPISVAWSETYPRRSEARPASTAARVGSSFTTATTSACWTGSSNVSASMWGSGSVAFGPRAPARSSPGAGGGGRSAGRGARCATARAARNRKAVRPCALQAASRRLRTLCLSRWTPSKESWLHRLTAARRSTPEVYRSRRTCTSRRPPRGISPKRVPTSRRAARLQRRSAIAAPACPAQRRWERLEGRPVPPRRTTPPFGGPEDARERARRSPDAKGAPSPKSGERVQGHARDVKFATDGFRRERVGCAHRRFHNPGTDQHLP